jgi:hypothetical protein
MTEFEILPNQYLEQRVQGFYHTAFGGKDMPGNPNFLYKLKNDPHHKWTNDQIRQAQYTLENILTLDLPIVRQRLNVSPLTVCVVPRAKADNSYLPNQLLFKAGVRNVVQRLGREFVDGNSFITRHTNTKTTHLRLPMQGVVNDGRDPYPGISEETCEFSPNISNRDILLIDDIYTKTINIDEDMIQALFNYGARTVAFYAIGNTIQNH